MGQQAAAVQISRTFFWSTLLYSIGTFIFDEAHILFDLWQKWQQSRKWNEGKNFVTTEFQQALIKTGSVESPELQQQ